VRKEVREDRRRTGKLEGGRCGWMRDSAVRKGGTVVGSRGFRSRRMVEGGEKNEFACKIAKGTKEIKSKGGEEYMIGSTTRLLTGKYNLSVDVVVAEGSQKLRMFLPKFSRCFLGRRFRQLLCSSVTLKISATPN
jgi:hypothetical protein